MAEGKIYNPVSKFAERSNLEMYETLDVTAIWQDIAKNLFVIMHNSSKLEMCGSLAYTPLGAVVLHPSEYLWKTLTDHLSA